MIGGLIGNLWLSSFGNGGKEFVVEDGLEMRWWVGGWYLCWFRGIRIVICCWLGGGEMMSFLAGGCKCLGGCGGFVKNAVD
ncbi:hypothetical protein, partial [Bacillus altitudinis]|uniref:hypothetical protein n=1 Tax=Bacillus altitudinis TaxID=293387 RepID=UPI001C92FECC